MYLTANHPHIVAHLASLRNGLWATPEGLVIKVSKECILTAKANGGFDFYLAALPQGGSTAHVLVTAFFDTEDEPLTCLTPLIRDDPATATLIALLSRETFNVFFFDELDRELLSVTVAGKCPQIGSQLNDAVLMDITIHRDALSRAEAWFARRSESDDAAAVSVQIVEELFPSDMQILDAGLERHQFHGTNGFSTTALERIEPGAFQEQDIVFLFQRVFDQERIYLNPLKAVDGEEFVDILIVGEACAYLIQAKDSPNTERILRNTIKRKRTRSVTQVREAASQLKGAFSFVARHPELILNVQGVHARVDLRGKPLVGIVVVKELFNDSMQEYSEIIFELMDRVGHYCLVFDYPELAQMTLHCRSEDKYLGAVQQILNAAAEHGELPRLRYSGSP